MDFLVAHPLDMAKKSLKPGDFDAVLVTGDAYVDHPSFGAALIGRVLEDAGYRIAILSRPDPDDPEVFRMFGRPRLAWLVTAGGLDSMVSSYTANKKLRSTDDFAPGGNPAVCLRADGTLGPGIKGRNNARPDRAVIVYANRCRQAYKGVPVVIGGIEASLRRLSHYDYWSNRVRRSILLDAKADILVYGMGEQQVLEIIGRLDQAANAGTELDLSGIRGTVWAVHDQRLLKKERTSGIEAITEAIFLPSFEEVSAISAEGRLAYAESFRIQYHNSDPWSARRLMEPCENRLVVQEPPAFPLDREALDRVYALPFMREAHPMYDTAGGVPALSEVQFSLLSSRGCFGGCSFCSLAFHEGRVVTSRSIDSIVKEAQELIKKPNFKGYIHDVGGPTANFRGPACTKMTAHGACTHRLCLAPQPCPNLEPDHREYRELLARLRALPGVKRVFIRSGIRYDYLMLDRDRAFFRDLVEHHISGQLKVAPEHVSDRVLALMGKPPHEVFDRFAAEYRQLNMALGKKQYLVPYFISGHPGATLEDALELALYLKRFGFVPDQVQDFYPTPGTLSTAMWYTGLNPLDGKALYVARGDHERALQRALLQFNKPEHHRLVREALTILGRTDLIGTRPGCLVPPDSRDKGRRRSVLA